MSSIHPFILCTILTVPFPCAFQISDDRHFLPYTRTLPTVTMATNQEAAASDKSYEEAVKIEKLQKAKAQLELETGKKYKVKEKLPSVQQLILENALKKKTFAEAITFPAILIALFIVSLHLFLKFMPPAEKKYVLPQMKQRYFAQQQQIHASVPHKEASLLNPVASLTEQEGDETKTNHVPHTPLEQSKESTEL
jgi:hypothetical protein